MALATVNVSPKVLLDEKLCGQEDFTVEWILNSLVQHDPVFQKLHLDKQLVDCQARDLSGEKGFFSAVLKIDLFLEDSAGQPSAYSTVLKIPTTTAWKKVFKDESVDLDEVKFGSTSINVAAVQLHNTECQFYEHLSALIPQYIPRVHQSMKWDRGVQQGYLHMEDLTLKGTTLNYFNSLTEKQFKSVVNGLAHFHAKVLLLDAPSWKGKYTAQKESFSQMTDGMHRMNPLFLDSARNGKNELTRLYNHEKIQKIMGNQKFVDHAFFESFKDVGLPVLLVHGDLFLSNMLFKTDADGNLQDELIAFLDWQAVHEGNFLFDFVRLMLTSLDGDLRREMETTIFDWYLARLRAHLKDLECTDENKVDFTAGQLREAYDCLFLAHFGFIAVHASGALNARGRNVDTDTTEAALLDKCTLRCIHIYEDALRLLESGKFDQWL